MPVFRLQAILRQVTGMTLNDLNHNKVKSTLYTCMSYISTVFGVHAILNQVHQITLNNKIEKYPVQMR